MKNENFIVIQGWMCNELELKGNELLVYAIIYGFSQDGESCFSGSRNYIADTLNISLPTVDKALQGLLDKGYIIKQINDGTANTYWADLNMGVKKLYRGCKETLHNNIADNKTNKTISNDIVAETISCQDEKPKKLNLYQKCMAMTEEYTQNETLRKYLTDFLKICLENSREGGKPFYSNHWKSKLTKLSELADNEDMQIKIVKQTLDNGWANFYAYKDGGRCTGDFAKDVEHLNEGLNSRAERRSRSGEKF